MHIGVTDFGASTWTGGSNFTRLIARVLGAAPGVKCTLLGESGPVPGIRSVSLKDYYRHPGRIESFVRGAIRKPAESTLQVAVRKEKIDVVLPLVDMAAAPDCARIGWIPDFQHVVASQFFSGADIAARDTRCRKLAEFSARVLFSSRDAESTYKKLFPGFAAKSRVISFPSTLALDALPALVDVRALYNLPGRFVVVPNQFWRHKNHLTVLRALGILKRRGANVHCVFTGLLSDERDPANAYLSGVLQTIASEDVRGNVSMLGFVSRENLVSLLRTAQCVLQPSFSEGWSTSVQDARALGRPVICSDIPVLREQAPDAAGFFPPDDAEALAALLDQFANLPPGPNLSAEQYALGRERKAVDAYRESLLGLCREAIEK